MQYLVISWSWLSPRGGVDAETEGEYGRGQAATVDNTCQCFKCSAPKAAWLKRFLSGP